jgi:hypothetical protein
MRKKSWVPFLIFILTFSQIIDIQAQRVQKKIDFQWREPVVNLFSDGHEQTFLWFDGAVYGGKFPDLPAYYEMIPVENFFSDFVVRVMDEEFEEMNATDCQLVSSDFHQQKISYTIASAYDRKDVYAQLTFVPLVETSPGRYMRLRSVTLEIEGKNVVSQKGTRGHASQSILASGQWYQFSVSQTGVYKVTGQDLVAMGLQIPITSSQIAIFGNGGGMLPEDNAAPRLDDLQEIPIQMYDGGDGILDNGDYFLFYGLSPHKVYYDTADQKFKHSYNVYSDAAYYFVTPTPGIGEKKRVQTIDNESLNANKTVQDFTFFGFYEEDITNLCESGRTWLGDRYDITLTRSYGFELPAAPVGTGRVTVRGASTATTTSAFQVSVNQNNIGNSLIGSVENSVIACISVNDLSCKPTSRDMNVTLTYNKPITSAVAYLDWIEVEMPCSIALRNGQTSFRNPSTVGPGNVSEFRIAGVSPSVTVWDVTDPFQTVRYAMTADNQGVHFKVATDELREFVVFDGTKYLTVTPLSSVANQNLHATGAVDMVIVAHPDFLSQANRLAQYRSESDGLKVKVVTPQQIYNEFSSGSQDPIAIRDYMKMIYDRTNKEYPKYLLLVGRPCYDFRGRVQGTAIYVPNYQYDIEYKMSQRPQNYSYISDLYHQYSNDDVLGLLDDSEGDGASGLFDLGVGRFPCTTVSQASVAVDKSIRYTEKRNLVPENSPQISNFGDWRNVMAFVADDEEHNDFIIHADSFARIVAKANPNINFDKMYLDAYQQVSNAGGQRYPDAVTDINNRMNRGSLFYTYIGHSGKDGWAAERVLENSDINRWNNYYNLTSLLSLSCTFAYYDRPAESPADLIFFNNNGGAVSVIAATREAWSSPNNNFGVKIFNQMFQKDENGNYYSVSDLERICKNKCGGSTNANLALAMFVVFGDPSIRLAVPTYNIVTDSINHQAVGSANDTIRALSKVTVCGRVTDDNMQTLSTFNGSVFPLVFDKKETVSTLMNDPDPNVDPFEFEVQKSVLFKGNATVTDGRFQFSFYVPKDINYSFGNGKISYYGRTEKVDATGAFTDFIIGGMDTTGIEDDECPVVELFMNDENFVNGGITGTDPVLIARISDNFGINTTGNGIGHDLTGVLDNNSGNKIVLNDYYQTEKDSFNCGKVRYPLQNLAPGDHTITVRAWDVNNNSAEQTLTFRVVSEDKLELSHVLNYPNPFTTHTEFYFEHNQPGGTFDIQVNIYTISGKLVRTLYDTQYMEGNRCRAIPWDGLDDFGDKLAKGTYLYRVRVKSQEGKTAEVVEKLVIL